MGNDLEISEIAKYLGNGLDIWGTASVFEIRHKYVANDLNILNMSSMFGKRLKYLRNGFSMLEMAYEFDNGLFFFFFCVRCDDRAKSSSRWLLGSPPSAVVRSLPPELGAHFSVFWPKLLAYCLQVWAGLKDVLRGLLLRATFTVG